MQNPLENISNLSIGVIACALFVMLFFAIRHLSQRRKGENVDYKGVIVSAGVLGTFVGIFLGLWEFDTQNIESSVPDLLEGLKIAFFTSIVGLSLSVVLSWFESATPEASNDEVGHLKRISDKLDGDGPLALRIGQLNDSVSQVRNDGHNYHVALTEKLDRHFSETNEALTKAVDQLSRSATSEIISALDAVITDFNKNLKEQFGENFKQLNEAVAKLLDWQENYRQQVEANTDHLAAIQTSMAGSDATLREIASRNKDVIEVHGKLAVTLETQSEQLKKSAELLGSQVSLATELNSMVEQFSMSIKSIESSVEGYSDKIQESLSTQSEAFGTMSQELEKQLPEALGELNRTLTALTQRFSSDYESFLQKIATLNSGLTGRLQ